MSTLFTRSNLLTSSCPPQHKHFNCPALCAACYDRFCGRLAHFACQLIVIFLSQINPGVSFHFDKVCLCCCLGVHLSPHIRWHRTNFQVQSLREKKIVNMTNNNLILPPRHILQIYVTNASPFTSSKLCILLGQT